MIVYEYYHFYRAKPSGVRYCQGKLSVRPFVCLSVCLSVCPSVTLRYRDHRGWNSAKITSRLISLTFSLSADPNMSDLLTHLLNYLLTQLVRGV